jgi:hypothetical protein
MDVFTYLDKLNWQGIIAMFAIVWYFTRDIRQTIIQLEERIFLLATGKTLAQAMLDEKMKREDKK